MSKIIRQSKNRMSKATLLGEPSMPGYIQLTSNMLKRTANLSDLTDVAEARKNLGVSSIDDLSIAATPNSIVQRDGNSRFKIMDAEATNEPVSLNQLNNKQYSLSSNNITGVLPVAKGGTGANNATKARNNLGLGALATKNSISWNEVKNKPALAPMPTQSAIHSIGPGTAINFRLPQGGAYFLIGKIGRNENGTYSQSPYMCVKPGGTNYANVDNKFKGWSSHDTFAWKIS